MASSGFTQSEINNIKAGLESWNGQANNSGITFNVTTNPAPPPGTANTIVATYDDHQSSGDIAHLQLFSSGSSVSASMVFHQNIRNATPENQPAFVRKVSKHEGGHAQGLANAENCTPGTTIMNPNFSDGTDGTITTCDNTEINADAAYPAPPPPPPGGGGGPPCPGSDCNEGSGTQIDNCSYGEGCPGGTVNTGSCCQPDYVSPIIVDVDGGGFHMCGAADGVWFDFFGNGNLIKISWIAASSTNAFLVLDRNGNGLIDSGRELFGNLTPQPRTPEAHGFLALAEYDKPENGGNGDGLIKKTDAIFTSLRLWQDVNHNGVSEPAELHSLKALGLKTLDLDWRTSRRVDEYGNQFRYRARVKDDRDAQLGRWAWDVFLTKAN